MQFNVKKQSKMIRVDLLAFAAVCILPHILFHIKCIAKTPETTRLRCPLYSDFGNMHHHGEMSSIEWSSFHPLAVALIFMLDEVNIVVITFLLQVLFLFLLFLGMVMLMRLKQKKIKFT